MDVEEQFDQCESNIDNEYQSILTTPSCSKDKPSANVSSTSCGQLSWNSTNKLALMYKMRPKLCDVCLLTDDGLKIHAHRVVLASSMHYFSTMFIGADYSEESTDIENNLTLFNLNFIEQRQYTISIKNIDYASLNELVKYCYLGSVNVNESNVQILLSAATMLSCKDVIKICSDFLISKLQTSNALGIYTYAELIGCKDLKESSFSFILNNFVEIMQKDEFVQLSAPILADIIASDCLYTGKEGEHVVISAVVKWASFDDVNRRQYLPLLIQHIRFPKFNHQELLNLETDYPLIFNEYCSKDLLIEALKYHLITNSCGIESFVRTSNSDFKKFYNYQNISNNSLDLTNARFRERVSLPRQQCLIVIGGQAPKAICQCEYYDFSTNQWNEFICDLPTRRCRSGIVVLNGLIYAIGGFNGQCRVRTVDLFDPKLNQWTQCASLEVKRSTLGACVLDGLIYAVGGFDGLLGLQTAEVYNPITRSWRFIAPMTTRRSSVAVVTLNGLLYAIGGYDGSSRQCLSSVESYNPETDQWTKIADMSQRRSGAGVDVLCGKIYAIGGHDGPAIRKSVECYDPVTNTWSQCADMIFARRNAVVVAKDRFLYVIGGEDGHTNLKSVEIYDPSTNSWSLLSSEMNIGRSYAGVAIIDKTWN